MNWLIKTRRFSMLLTLLSWQASGFAANTLEINADTLFVDGNKQISIYKGHVKIKHQTMQITAESVLLHQVDSNIKVVVIEGSPARLDHKPAREAAVQAEANRIEYHVSLKLLILEGNARVTQADQTFSGEKIRYDLASKQLQASGGKEQNSEQPSRVHVIIGPEQPEGKP